jgi:tektin-2
MCYSNFPFSLFSLLAWKKLNELIEVRFKLNIDINDKREAQDIDSEQMALTKDSALITYKVDPLRVPRNSCTYNGWLENCKELKLLSDKELKESYNVRESLFVAREKAKNLLHAQQEKTELTIRRRIFETQRQRNELQWQKTKVCELWVVKRVMWFERCEIFCTRHINLTVTGRKN